MTLTPSQRRPHPDANAAVSANAPANAPAAANTDADADADATNTGAAAAAAESTLRVIRGTPTAEELAALTAVVVALSENSVEPDAVAPHRTWARRDQLRLAPRPGPGSWRRSGR